jgi:hypothetical protein
MLETSPFKVIDFVDFYSSSLFSDLESFSFSTFEDPFLDFGA